MSSPGRQENEDIHWTDSSIRWPEDDAPAAKQKLNPKDDNDNDNENENDDDEEPIVNIFAQDDQREIFSFNFRVKDDDDDDDDDDGSNVIQLNIHGYKTDSDEVWQSTGLTLWKASKHLCHYMCEKSCELHGKRILELGKVCGCCRILRNRKLLLFDGQRLSSYTS